jgi:peptidoglycan/LPS O-acetylase OafA/YrhL
LKNDRKFAEAIKQSKPDVPVGLVGAQAKVLPTETLRASGDGSRLPGLDVLRFVAVSLVIYSHVGAFDTTRISFIRPVWLWDALKTLREGAWVGVDIFFVLSGFLVSGLLFEELSKRRTVSVGRFLIRRGFKIYPAFWLMILVTVIGIWIEGNAVSMRTLLSELFYVQNYVPTRGPSGFWGHTWTLAVEEHFYFLLAGLFVFLKWRAAGSRELNVHIIPRLFAAVAILCLGLRIATWAYFSNHIARTHIWSLCATHVRIDSLFYGVLLSYLWHYRWSEAQKARISSRRWLFLIGGLVLLYPATRLNEDWVRVFGFISFYLGSGCLLLSVLSLDRSPVGWLAKSLAWLGKHSYSVYLWHVMAGSWLFVPVGFKTHSLPGWLLNVVIYFTLCWIIGILMARLVEFPVLKIRDRLFPGLRLVKLN